MAKEQPPRQAKARILFGFAEFDGADPSVVENVRSIAASVVRALQSPQPIRPVMRTLPLNPANGKAKEEDKTLFDEPEVEIIEQGNGDEEAFDLEAEPAPAAPKEPKTLKKAPVYQFVTDLNLRPEGKQSLKEFYTEKKPGDQQEAFAVIMFYLAKILGMTGISANHLYTALQEVKRKVPTDILQICRNVKSRKGWIDPSDGDNVRITTQGENLVNHELPKQPTA